MKKVSAVSVMNTFLEWLDAKDLVTKLSAFDVLLDWSVSQIPGVR